jgi:hypothetical protein
LNAAPLHGLQTEPSELFFFWRQTSSSSFKNPKLLRETQRQRVLALNLLADLLARMATDGKGRFNQLNRILDLQRFRAKANRLASELPQMAIASAQRSSL